MAEEKPSVCETVPRPQVVLHVQHVRNGVVIDEFDVDASAIKQSHEEVPNGHHE